MSTVFYSDLDFKLNKNLSGDSIKRDNENSINQSLYSLFNTQKGERPFNPEYGTNLKRFQFESLSEENASKIINDIKMAITSFEEDRVKIKELNINVNYSDLSYEIYLGYEILNTIKEGKFSFILKKL